MGHLTIGFPISHTSCFGCTELKTIILSIAHCCVSQLLQTSYRETTDQNVISVADNIVITFLNGDAAVQLIEV